MGIQFLPAMAWASWVVLVVLGACICTGEAYGSDQLVTELQDDSVDMLQIETRKLKTAKEVKALVDKHGSPEAAKSNNTESSAKKNQKAVKAMGATIVKQMTEKLEAMEKKLNEVHKFVQDSEA